MNDLLVLVLAAGLSRRMGQHNKLLLPVQGVPMVRRVVDQALQVSDQVRVVVGHQASQVQAALAGCAVQLVYNPDYAQGMATSLRAGALAVPSGRAVLVCLGDMPGVQAAHMQSLQAAWQATPGFAAYQPVYQGRRGNPVLWAPDALSYLYQVAGDVGARQQLTALRAQGRVLDVPVSTAAVLYDVDTYEAWQALQQS